MLERAAESLQAPSVEVREVVRPVQLHHTRATVLVIRNGVRNENGHEPHEDTVVKGPATVIWVQGRLDFAPEQMREFDHERQAGDGERGPLKEGNSLLYALAYTDARHGVGVVMVLRAVVRLCMSVEHRG
jgi:hypothetical protein